MRAASFSILTAVSFGAVIVTAGSAAGQSSLRSIQEVGRDGTIVGGVVTGGTRHPLATFTYAPAALSWPGLPTGPVRYVRNHPRFAGVDLSRVREGDFDGDGRTDLLTIDGWGDAPGVAVHLSRGDGTFHPPVIGFSYPVAGDYDGAMLDLSRLRLGDFDGDGRTDLAVIRGLGGSAAIHVHLASGGGAFAPPVAGPVRGISPDVPHAMLDVGRVIPGDFNGDGRTDLLAVEGAGYAAPMSVYVSRGDGTFASAIPGPTRTLGAGLDRARLDLSRIHTADFNGDGVSDLAAIEGWGATAEPMSIWIGRGDGSFRPRIEGPAHRVAGDHERAPVDLTRVRFVDVNGDGETDVVTIASSGDQRAIEVHFSRGDGSFGGNVFGPTRRVHAAAAMAALDLDRVSFEDVDGDGISDLIAIEGWGGSSTMTIHRGRGDGRFGGRLAGPSRAIGSTIVAAGNDLARVHTGDFDGDGRLDFAAVEGMAVALPMTIYLGGGERPGLMTRVDNGVGGRVEITYAPSTTWTNTNNPAVQPTVTQMLTDDGRGGRSARAFAYAGGLVDRQGRRFLGYRWVRTTEPCLSGEPGCAVEGAAQGPYAETWHHQSYGNVAKPERTDIRDATGRLLSSRSYEYLSNGAQLPYVSLLEGAWAYTYADDGSSERTYSRTWYDVWGNATYEVMYGNWDVNGDERSIRTVYRPNADAFIVSLPAVVDTFDGILGEGGPPPNLLAQAVHLYDGASTWDQPPSRGALTRADQWRDTCNCFVSSHQGFDTWGNVVVELDANGAETTREYDPLTHERVVREVDPLGRETLTSWDLDCGVATSATDVRGDVTTYTVDARCQVSRIDTPDGRSVTYSDVAWGDPAAQHRVTRVLPDDLARREYFDGTGWVYRTEAPGGEPGVVIVTERELNGRGELARESRPRLPSEVARWTIWSYDALDRVVRLTHPDGSFTQREYDLGLVRSIDGEGHVVEQTTDHLGRLIEHRERNGAAWHTRRHEYGLGWERVIDPAGNVLTVSVDSLGNLIAEVDPDRGSRSYEYDAGGRLTAAVDAIGQRTEIEYDAAGRPIRRTLRADTPGAETVTMIYDEPRHGFDNVDRLTSVIAPAATREYDHDELGRKVRETLRVDGLTFVRRTGYDSLGRLAWHEYPDGDTIGVTVTPSSVSVRPSASRRPSTRPSLRWRSSSPRQSARASWSC